MILQKLRGPRRPRPVLLAVFLLAACRRESREGENAPAPAELSRGDVVVVERAAAEFFQARVLSVAGQTLKVQSADEGEPAVVARDDATRVGPKWAPVAPGPAVCNDAPSEWHACIVVATAGESYDVRLVSGGPRRLPREGVLSPSPVTALDVRRLFERVDASRQFAESARAAGEPASPRGWIPERREPVIARRGEEWLSGHVESLTGDGGVVVRWDGDEHPAPVPASAVVPVPPFARAFERGQFVLIPPSTQGQSWRRVRIDGLGPDEAVVVDETSARLRVSVRRLVPLAAPPSPARE